tara:strand:- start:413 stop:622 length:210 start_codon:yes stop_codon:yes gene_type:complete
MAKTNKKEIACKSKAAYGCSGCGYFLGFLGAVIYYISTATGFWMGVLGVLKALVWPAFLVYEVLKYLAV